MLKMYAGEHNGAMPPTLTELYPEYATDLSVFVCPSTGEAPGDPSNIDSWTSYEYISPGTDYDSTLVVCQDKSHEHHIPGGRNQLFADGRVEFRRGP